MGVQHSVEKIVASRSRGFCDFKGCVTSLIADATDSSPERVRGQIAHIAGDKPGSARFDPSMQDAERNAASNLMFLCRDHHADIDNQPETYTVDLLRQWKRDKKQATQLILKREMAELDFPELSAVCEAFAGIANAVPKNASLQLTAPLEKIRKNELQEIEDDIGLGLARVKVVREFIQERNKVDASFSDRLRYGFKTKYAEFRYAGLSSIDTYLELVSHARRYSKKSAPALAIVYALFESCDIFDP